MSTFIELSQNIALLLALTFLYGFIYPRLERMAQRMQKILKGLLFGLFAVISMTMPIQVSSGLFYDGRTIVICIAGIYGGTIPAFIAALLVAVFRISIGGLGTTGALGSAAIAALLGIGLHRYYRTRARRPDAIVLLLAGLALALVGMLLAALLPSIGSSILTTSLPTTVIIYPFGLLLLGSLVANQQHSLEMEHALHENERRFRALFNSSFQFTGLLKPDGTLLEVNQTMLELGGVQPADVIGRTIQETPWWPISSEIQAHLKDAFGRAAHGELVRYEADLKDARGAALTVDFTLTPIRDKDERIVLLVLDGRDVSARKELEQQKIDLVLERERARLLKKFISDVSHDLRTPLSVMRLNLELLRRTDDPEKQQMRIETLASQEQHLTRLLTDMMIMLSLDDVQGTFKFKPLDLNFVVQMMLDAHQSSAQRKQQKLTFIATPDRLLIQADQVELERALSKLLVNAVSYTLSGGSITVKTLKDGENAVVEVGDTGIGIAPDDLPNIFQRFFRADKARSMDTGGTGLGLPIAKKIIETHGGSIKVESTPDAGSTFRVLLPLLSTEAQPAATDPVYD